MDGWVGRWRVEARARREKKQCMKEQTGTGTTGRVWDRVGTVVCDV